jgi:serine/threonine protein kinase
MNIIDGKYQLTKELGKGQFGSICEATCIRTSRKFAVKLEKQNIGFSLLKHEATILHHLKSQKCFNIPSIFYYGVCQPHVILVMTYYDQSLENLREVMKVEEKIEWWNQSIRALEKIHKSGIVHRDIKPAHFMHRYNSGCEWNIIDFGLASSYLDEYGYHIEEVTKTNIIGSPDFVSIFVHTGYDPVCRDDIVSLIYVLWFVLYGVYLDPQTYSQTYSQTNDEEILNDRTSIYYPYNRWLLEQKQWKNFYSQLDKVEIDTLRREKLYSILLHAERLRFSEKPNYSHFYWVNP